jgi:predicted short-subunit dehydrogenase-like oxidoreductase (DUF2520 family)
LIGAGNVATHFGIALKKAGHEIVQVFSRSSTSAATLSAKLKCNPVTDVPGISKSADLYIISISDQAIRGFLRSFPADGKVVVHTSGTISLKVFGKKFGNHGVIYPLQTFSKERKIKFEEVPLLVEASNAKTLSIVNAVADSVSRFVFRMDSSTRKTVHLSAVIAGNFSNHLYLLAEKVLEKKNIPLPLLGPLLYETVIKAIRLTPRDAQTGPAKRGDTGIIKEHLKMLKGNPSLQKIYRLMSEDIERESGARF